jgi:hypothetical protein
MRKKVGSIRHFSLTAKLPPPERDAESVACFLLPPSHLLEGASMQTATEQGSGPAGLHDDIAALVRAVHQDREAALQKEQKQREKEKSESWTRYVSLTIVSLAVCAAIGSLKAGGFSSRSLLRQTQATDAWGYFQAKGIKLNMVEVALLLVPKEKEATLKREIAHYENEKIDIKNRAEALEKERDEAAKHGPPLATAIAFLQIAIAVSSVCLLTKKKRIWLAGGALGAVGVAWLIYGLFII